MSAKLILLCLIATLVVAQQNINENEDVLSTSNEGPIGQLNQSINELNTSLSMPKMMIVIGGLTRGNDSGKSVEAYDFEAAKWNKVLSLPSSRYSLGAATLNGKVYAIGGCEEENINSNVLQRVHIFDPLTQKWTSAPNMNYKRNSFGVSVLDGKIYVVGGGNGFSWLNSVEMFDGEQWTEIGLGMNTKRAAVAVGVLNGNIYAIGGNDGNKYLKTVERMNPATGVWEFVASMNVSRRDHSVAVLDEKLYAIGGWNGSETLKSVEFYDPDLNRWTFVADLNTPRDEAGAVAYGGQIYVVGGAETDLRSGSLDTTEVYNPNLNKWNTLPSRMSTSRYSHGVALL